MMVVFWVEQHEFLVRNCLTVNFLNLNLNSTGAEHLLWSLSVVLFVCEFTCHFKVTAKVKQWPMYCNVEQRCSKSVVLNSCNFVTLSTCEDKL